MLTKNSTTNDKRNQPRTESDIARLRQEAELAIAWQQHGCVEARNTLVTANLGLVVAVAKRYRHSGVPLDELIAEGNMGLLNAVNGYDPECGSRFSTYATYWIRHGISNAFAKSTPRGKLSGRDRKTVTEVERAVRRHYQRFGETPSVAQLAEELGWPSRMVEERCALMRAFSRPAALSAGMPGRDAEGPISTDSLNSTDFTSQDASAEVSRLLDVLLPMERTLVERRFGLCGCEPQPIGAIAESLGRTRHEVRTILRIAMHRLSRAAQRSTQVSSEDGAARRVA